MVVAFCYREREIKMSLDVYLIVDGYKSSGGSGIFIRENGAAKEISREEWGEKFPNTEPVVFEQRETDYVYSRNITHNLNKMADEAGIYSHLWRPDEIDVNDASQLIEPLEKGLEILKSNPSKFKQFNPSSGWGTYEGLVDFVDDYLNACKKYPHARIEVSR